MSLVAATLLAAGVCSSLTLTDWRADRDLQQHGTRSRVVILAVEHHHRTPDKVRVQMPDNTVAVLDAEGPGDAGDKVEVVYWPDAQGHAEWPGGPSSDTVTGLVLGCAFDLLCLGVLGGLLLPPIRRARRRRRPPSAIVERR